MRIVDLDGNERDWAWLVGKYGNVQIVPCGEVPCYVVDTFFEEKGAITFHAVLRDEWNVPVFMQPVTYRWPGGSKNETTDAAGKAEHSGGEGEGYNPKTNQGPASWKVYGVASEEVVGIGWLHGTDHERLGVGFIKKVSDEEPPDDRPGCWQAFKDWLIGILGG